MASTSTSPAAPAATLSSRGTMPPVSRSRIGDAGGSRALNVPSASVLVV